MLKRGGILGMMVVACHALILFFFSSRRRHTRLTCDWSSDVCSSDLKSRARASRHSFYGFRFFFSNPAELGRHAQDCTTRVDFQCHWHDSLPLAESLAHQKATREDVGTGRRETCGAAWRVGCSSCVRERSRFSAPPVYQQDSRSKRAADRRQPSRLALSCLRRKSRSSRA